jgi:micrococcal nuclease
MTFALLIFFLLLPVWSLAEDLPNVQWLNCHDGDTCAFNVLLPPVLGANIGIRFSGIDTPEINGKCTKEKALAIVARDFLIAQMQAAKSILVHDVSRDARFRIDGTVIADGVNLNQLMLSKGYAVLYSGTGPRHDWCAP